MLYYELGVVWICMIYFIIHYKESMFCIKYLNNKYLHLNNNHDRKLVHPFLSWELGDPSLGPRSFLFYIRVWWQMVSTPGTGVIIRLLKIHPSETIALLWLVNFEMGGVIIRLYKLHPSEYSVICESSKYIGLKKLNNH